MFSTCDKNDIQNFNILTSRINNLIFNRAEADKDVLMTCLDGLNSINYKQVVLSSPTKVILLINQSCTLTPTNNPILVSKCSKLIKTLLYEQNVCIEGRTSVLSIQWCIQSLKINDTQISIDVLQALESLLRNSPKNVKQLGEIVNEMKKIIEAETDHYMPYLTLHCLQCLEACVSFDDVKFKKPVECYDTYKMCANIFKKFLSEKLGSEEFIKCKILKVCLLGLQNIIFQNPTYLDEELGYVLGIVKVHMLYGIKSTQHVPPTKLVPSVLSVPEVSVAREAKGGKLTKQRKHKPLTTLKNGLNQNEDSLEIKSGYVPATSNFEYNSDSGMSVNILENSFRISDSDYSDSEGSKLAKTKQAQAKVRQASLSLFYNIIKNTEKSIIFSYWTNFIPESTLTGDQNLITCFLKDPSSKCRIAALNVTLLLLSSSKLYLSQAAASGRSSSFTPFCAILALTIKQIHNSLNMALKEISPGVLTQVLKCYAALVEATPYHKLEPGLIVEVIKNVRPFIYYKDATVQVKALIVLGCILAFEPILPEVKEAMLRLFHNAERKDNIGNSSDNSEEQFEYAEFSDPEEESETEKTPIPWLLKRVLNNLGVKFSQNNLSNTGDVTSLTAVAPVKLESVQILSAMSRNYFESFMAPYLPQITKALELSMSDKYPDLRLHAGRAIEFIGRAIDKTINNEDKKHLTYLENYFSFWQTLLTKGLPDLLQSDQRMLRGAGCDCLSSMSSRVFEQLPKEKQISCVVHLFSCARDEDNIVRGAAVRGLALFVLYPSLRQDPGFVFETAESICRICADENSTVRMKALWSLGNLSDALILNKKSEEYEDIPNQLLLKLLKISLKSTEDNYKIQMNAVRATGNLMQLVTDDLMKDVEFLKVVENGFELLTKSCTSGSHMKVRWNACYALGSAMKNPAFYGDSCSNVLFVKKWQELVFNSLSELVVNFQNFKVRINAASALSAPSTRNQYGNFFIPLWKVFLTALENTENVEGANEYKHKDNLINQICLSLAHFTTLLTKEDLLLLNDVIQLYSEKLKEHVGKVLERLVPEKSTALYSAGYSLKQLRGSDLTTEEKEVVGHLINIFEYES